MNKQSQAARLGAGFVVLAGLAATPAWAMERVSISTDSAQGNWQSRNPAISANGRYIAFESDATTLVAGDTNDAADIFVRDRVLNTTTRVSLMHTGAQSPAPSRLPSISGDGQRIVFTSNAVLVPNAGVLKCYLVDLTAGTVSVIDVRADNGLPANGTCQSPSISRSGNRIAFATRGDNLLAPGLDTNGWADIFVRDLAAGTTTRVNLGPGGVQGNMDAWDSHISGDGSKVAYTSLATNLVAADTNGVLDIFVSTLSGMTARVNVGPAPANAQANAAGNQIMALNHDGTMVAFSDNNSSTLPGWSEFVESVVYLRVPGQGSTQAMSLPVNPNIVREGFNDEPSLSADGRFLVFYSSDQLLTSPENNGGVFVIDRLYSTMALVNVGINGDAGHGNVFGTRISADGGGIVFYSNAADLVQGDTNGTWDVFYTENPLYDGVIFADGFE
jgi:Tol biopolymer transport system component